MREGFLPGVPRKQIEELYNAAPGNEIASGKFDSPESSVALAANTFGFFLNRQGDLPPLPGCEDAGWPASSLTLEKEVRFPWRARWGHPVLDVLISTSSALIGIEAKRFEPFRDDPEAHFTDTYWRKVWGWSGRLTNWSKSPDAMENCGGVGWTYRGGTLPDALALAETGDQRVGR